MCFLPYLDDGPIMSRSTKLFVSSPFVRSFWSVVSVFVVSSLVYGYVLYNGFACFAYIVLCFCSFYVFVL